MLAAARVTVLGVDVGETGSGGLCCVVRTRRLCVLSLLQRLLLQDRCRSAGTDEVKTKIDACLLLVLRYRSLEQKNS